MQLMAKGRTLLLDMETVGTWKQQLHLSTASSSLVLTRLWLQSVYQDTQESVREESPSLVC